VSTGADPDGGQNGCLNPLFRATKVNIPPPLEMLRLTLVYSVYLHYSTIAFKSRVLLFFAKLQKKDTGYSCSLGPKYQIRMGF
jgi:hypothetical protein